MFLRSAVELLQFGLFGVTILLAYLAYQLMRQALAKPKPHREQIKAAKFYFVFSFVFMLGAGALNVWDQTRAVKFWLKISPWSSLHGKHGDIFVQHQSEPIRVEKEKMTFAVRNGEQIDVDMQYVMSGLLEAVKDTQSKLKQSRSDTGAALSKLDQTEATGL